MRARAILMLGLAILLGGLAIILVRQWVAQQTASTAPAPTRTVVVARVALNFGDRITAATLREAEFPQDLIPPGSFVHIEDLTKPGEERVVLRAIDMGEPVLASKVSGPGGRATLSTIIEKGMRAITIRVNDITGAAGFVLPNDRVDILLTRTPEGSPQPTTDVLLQNMKVLAIDQLANDKADKPIVARAVTLEVTEEQAQKLTLAQQVGTLSLALRNQANAEATPVRTIGVNDLRVGEANVPPPAPKVEAPPPPPSPPVQAPRASRADPLAPVNVVRGIQGTTVEVTREGGAPRESPQRRRSPSAAPPAGG